MQVYDPEISKSLSPGEFVEEVGSIDRLGNDEQSSHLAALLVQLAGYPNLMESQLQKYRDLLISQKTDFYYDTQSVMLIQEPKYFVRANIWPNFSVNSPRAARQYESTYSYNVPHNHGFSFITACHFGAGYETDVCRMIIDREQYEKLQLGDGFEATPVKRYSLLPGRAFKFDSVYDIHVQHPPDCMTITLNLVFREDVLHIPQYVVDLNAMTLISRPGGSAYTRQRILADIAVGLGGDYQKRLDIIKELENSSHPLVSVIEEAQALKRTPTN